MSVHFFIPFLFHFESEEERVQGQGTVTVICIAHGIPFSKEVGRSASEERTPTTSAMEWNFFRKYRTSLYTRRGTAGFRCRIVAG
jgi:hypothetical protein